MTKAHLKTKVINLPDKIEFSVYGGLSLWQAIQRELLLDTFLEILANIAVGKFSSETGASSIKKFEDGLFSTKFSKSDNSAKKNMMYLICWIFIMCFFYSKYYFNIMVLNLSVPAYPQIKIYFFCIPPNHNFAPFACSYIKKSTQVCLFRVPF
jgi:hypothetical protein